MADKDKLELTPAEENPRYQPATLGGDDHEECARLLFNTLWAIQTVTGTIFLFFLLLTIRNRFRLK
jgi:hypothetical protein